MYAEESTHWLPHVVAFALLPLGIAYARGRRLRQEEGKLAAAPACQYTEEAEPPPCSGQASLFLAFLAIAVFRGFFGSQNSAKASVFFNFHARNQNAQIIFRVSLFFFRFYV